MKRSTRESQHRAMVVVELDSQEGPGNRHSDMTEADFHCVLEKAFTESEIPWEDCDVDIVGTTATVLVAPEISKTRLIDQLPAHLVTALEQQAKHSYHGKRFKARLALHAGEVYAKDIKLPNSAVNFTRKLSELGELKTILHKSTTSLGIVVSDWFYQNVISQDSHMAPEVYQNAQADDADITGWFRLVEETSEINHPKTDAWILLLERLAHQNSDARKLIDLFACLATEPVPLSLLSGLQGVGISKDLADTLRNPLMFDRAINDIVRFGLASINAMRNTLLLHQRVHTIARCQMSPSQQQRMRRIAHLALVKVDPLLPGSTTYWPLYRELAPHVRASKAVQSDDSLVRRVVINLAVFHNAVGDPQTSLDIAQQAMTLWRTKLGESHPDTLAAARRVAVALRELGQFLDAKNIDKQTWKLLKDTIGPNSDETLILAGLLSSDLRAMGDFQGASDLNKDSYERAMQTGADYTENALYATHNLAISARLMGDISTAMELDYRTWQGRKKIFGEADRFTLLSLNHLASNMIDLGDFVSGRMRQEEAFLMHKSLLPAEHPQTLTTMRDLAIARRKTGDFQGAFALAQEAWQGLRRSLRETHPDAIAALVVLSTEHRYSGDLAIAHELSSKAWQLYREVLGERHPYTFISATNVAVALRLLGNPQQAHSINESSVRELQSLLGNNHPFTLSCSVNLASDLAALGDADSALTMETDVSTRLRLTQRDSYPLSVFTRLNYAIDLKILGQIDEARQEHTKVITALRDQLGPNHSIVFSSAQWIRVNYDFDPMPLI